MGNQYLDFVIGRLENVEFDLVGVNNLIAFEVIEIMDKIDPYPALLQIYRSYENYAIINLKNDTITFEDDGMQVT